MAEKSIDLLGETGRAQIVAGGLADAQRNAMQLEVLVAAHGLGDEDPAPITLTDAKQRTVAEAREALKAAEKRIIDAHSELMPAVRALVEQPRG